MRPAPFVLLVLLALLAGCAAARLDPSPVSGYTRRLDHVYLVTRFTSSGLRGAFADEFGRALRARNVVVTTYTVVGNDAGDEAIREAARTAGATTVLTVAQTGSEESARVVSSSPGMVLTDGVERKSTFSFELFDLTSGAVGWRATARSLGYGDADDRSTREARGLSDEVVIALSAVGLTGGSASRMGTARTGGSGDGGRK